MPADPRPVLAVGRVVADGPTWQQGPSVASLVQRLTLTSPDLLLGTVAVPALVADVAHTLSGAALPRPALDVLDRDLGPSAPESVRGTAGLVCWLALAPEVQAAPGLAAAAAVHGGPGPWFLAVLAGLTSGLAAVREPRTCVHDPEGREEAARAFLIAAGLCPAGESPQQAADRWQGVSSAHRLEVAGAVGEQARRAEELARLLAEKRAKEAAAQYANY